ncbi:HNH endonuclease, partial [Shigella flexneri]|uniref:HNH endonuclease n=1 Tax=Shigella flexneri TaxID=623 RepID=UPI0009CBB491
VGSITEVHHVNLDKQDNRIKNIRLMPKEKHRRIHKNVRKLIRLGHTQWLQPQLIEQSL